MPIAVFIVFAKALEEKEKRLTNTKFSGQVYVLSKDEGGRHTPFFNNYRPQFYFRTTDVTGVITLPEGTEMCMPGDNVVMNVSSSLLSLLKKVFVLLSVKVVEQ